MERYKQIFDGLKRESRSFTRYEDIENYLIDYELKNVEEFEEEIRYSFKDGDSYYISVADYSIYSTERVIVDDANSCSRAKEASYCDESITYLYLMSVSAEIIDRYPIYWESKLI